MPLSFAERILKENRELLKQMGISANSFGQAWIRTDSMESVSEVTRQVQRLNLGAWSETEWISQMQHEQIKQQQQLLAIGIMMAMGMRTREVKRLFLTEAAMIGLLGWLLGIGLSALAVLAINTGNGEQSILGMNFTEGMRIRIPGILALGALACAVITGLVAGIWPATAATRMQPLEAMRSGRWG